MILFAKAADEVLSLRRHRRRILKLPSEIRHNHFHLRLAYAFSPDGVPARQQVVHDDARGPNVRLLSVGEDIGNLFGRLVKKGATLREIGDRVQ